MAKRPDGGTPETGSDGDLAGVDLRALEARVRKCEEMQRKLLHRLDRVTSFASSELQDLFAD